MQNEQAYVNLLKDFKVELQQLLDAGKNLSEVSAYTYQQRENGRNIPYMSVSQKTGRTTTAIHASPTNKQKELKQFFDILADGYTVLTKYRFYIDLEQGRKVKFEIVSKKDGAHHREQL